MKRRDECQHLRKMMKDGQTEEEPSMGWWKDETYINGDMILKSVSTGKFSHRNVAYLFVCL